MARVPINARKYERGMTMTITKQTGRRALIRRILVAIGYYEETRETHMKRKAVSVFQEHWPLRNVPL